MSQIINSKLTNYFRNSSVPDFPVDDIENINNGYDFENNFDELSLVYLIYDNSEMNDIKQKIIDLLEIDNIYQLDLENSIMEEIKNTRINVDLIITSFNSINPKNSKFRLIIQNPNSLTLINSSKWL